MSDSIHDSKPDHKEDDNTSGYGPIDQPYEYAERLIDLPWFSGDKSDWLHRGLLTLALIALFIPLLGSFGLWDPWETHYGEVARQILERNDWISTWWGSHWEKADGTTEGSYFFSKPVLLMWLMAFGMKVFGFTAFGIRLGVCLIGILGVVSVYWMGRYLFSRRTGYIMAGVLATSPFWFFLSRQAQTDMPYVGLMTVGLCFYMVGMYGKNRNETVDLVGYILTLGWFGLVAIPQVSLVLVGLSRWRGRDELVFMEWMSSPLEQGISFGAMLLFASTALLLFALWRTQQHCKLRDDWLVQRLVPVTGVAIGLGLIAIAVPLAVQSFFTPPYLIFWIAGAALLSISASLWALTTEARLTTALSISVPTLSIIGFGVSGVGPPGIEYLAILATIILVSGASGIAINAIHNAWNYLENDADRFAIQALLSCWMPLIVLLCVTLGLSPFHARDLGGWFNWGPTQAALFSTFIGTVFYWVIRFPVKQRRRIYLLTFYLFIGFSTLSKGLLGFLLPGAVLFLYFVITRDWKRLTQVELPLGLLVFSSTGVPWYAAMLIRHPHGFWDRFFVHDHFKRFMSGVHQIDTGSFEHFIRWLGYGLFPWSAFALPVLFYFFSGKRLDLNSDKGRATLVILLWAIVVFALFTLSSTKFHHYIFPGIPPLALLTGLALSDSLDRDLPVGWPLYLAASGVMAILAWDIIADPQVLKDLFTYRYEREWDAEAWNPGFRKAMFLIFAPAVIGSLYFVAKNRVIRMYSLGAVFASAIAFTVFCLDFYMPQISSTWSQKQLWDKYYENCTRVEGPPGALSFKRFCKEPVISYHITWRGETFYTQNQIIPIHSDEDFEKFLKETGDSGFYGLMQRHTFEGEFQRKLPKRFEDEACAIHNKNIKFILVKVPCEDDEGKKIE